MKLFITIFASGICLLIIQISYAQNIVFDHYYTENGFLSAQALSIAKDTSGFLWIGTESGLVRYDAHSFRTYRSDPEDNNTPQSNYKPEIYQPSNSGLL